MVKLLTAIIVALCASGASANIVYTVNRTIGAGSVVGTIETDGTLGTIADGNILDWTFTLTSPSLASGSPDVITKAGAIQTSVAGTFLTASGTDLSFDFSGGTAGFMLFQGGNSNYWCVQTNGCFNFVGSAEALGQGAGAVPAELVEYNRVQVIASVRNAVPEPAMLSLVGLGLLGLAASRLKRV